MTREEAIEILTNLQNGHGVSYSEDYGLCFGHKWMQAYEMAISALRYDGPKYVLLSTPPADAQTIDTGVPFTNADHIRSMSDEELADYMSEHSIDDFCYIICGGECKAIASFTKTPFQRCREIVSDWLKQPYKEDT